MSDAGKADDFRRLIDLHTRAARKIAEEVFPESEIFPNGQLRFHRIAMAEIVTGLRWPHVHFYPFAGYLYAPLFGAQKTGHRAQKRRFARAIPARQHQRVAIA